MKIRRFIPQRKLRTTARRMPQRAMEDFGAEPSMSFGKALIVFIVLHVVAVSGIYIFNSLKARNIEQASPATRAVKQQASPASAGDVGTVVARNAGEDVKPVAKVSPKPISELPKAADTPHRKLTEEPVKTPVKETTVAAKDSGQFYTVVKGDNPVVIAKKLHVSYDELVKINKIEDPKKLKIGQKLRIPAKAKKQ